MFKLFRKIKTTRSQFKTFFICISFLLSKVVSLMLKSKITKILNSKENLNRKVPNQMAKSKVQTNQTN